MKKLISALIILTYAVSAPAVTIFERKNREITIVQKEVYYLSKQVRNM